MEKNIGETTQELHADEQVAIMSKIVSKYQSRK